MGWNDASREILAQSGAQFDPGVVDAFRSRHRELQSIQRELSSQRQRRLAPLAMLN
jgi:response regulator RpfG family c-di-GMP phosphodiesterase